MPGIYAMLTDEGLDAIRKIIIEEVTGRDVVQLVLAARVAVEFIDHWIGDHSMSGYPETGTLRAKLLQPYPDSARGTVAYIRRALTLYGYVSAGDQPVAQREG